jgi:ribosomal protein S18 acetylase RimI-like enzyme
MTLDPEALAAIVAETLTPVYGPLALDAVDAIVAELRDALPALELLRWPSGAAALWRDEGPTLYLIGYAGALDDALAALRGYASERGCRRLVSSGPPRWYLTSGEARAPSAWEQFGARRTSTHVDLVVDLTTLVANEDDPAVRRAAIDTRVERDETVRSWIVDRFSESWALEAERASRRRGLFVARERDATLGFVAHSGHCAAAGTFGPLGVERAHRGRSLGARLTRAALNDLRARGFERALIPWVDRGVCGFYERVVKIERVIEQARYEVALR